MKVDLSDSGFPPHERMYLSSNPLIRIIHNLRLKKAISLVSNAEGCLLEVGCGDGFFLRKVRVQYKIGLDISKIRLNGAKLISPNVEIVLGDAHHLPFKSEAFDKILCLDTLEHLYDPSLAIKEMLRMSKQYGEIIVSTPNEKIGSLGRLLLFKPPLTSKVHRHDISTSALQDMFGSKPVGMKRIPFDYFPLSLWKAHKYRKISVTLSKE